MDDLGNILEPGAVQRAWSQRTNVTGNGFAAALVRSERVHNPASLTGLHGHFSWLRSVFRAVERSLFASADRGEKMARSAVIRTVVRLLTCRLSNDIMISLFKLKGLVVGQLVVRNIENTVKAQLQRRAKRHGRSMEEEVRDILRSAVREEETLSGGLGTDISRLFMEVGLDSDVSELRGHSVKPAVFES